jgi:hypothetical protein
VKTQFWVLKKCGGRREEKEEETNEEDMKKNGSEGYTEEKRIKLLFCFHALSLILRNNHFSLPKIQGNS